MSTKGLEQSVAVLTAAGWVPIRPYTFAKQDLEITFDTSNYVELYKQDTRIAEARICSVTDMRQFLNDNGL